MHSKSGIMIALLVGMGASMSAQTGLVTRSITVADNAGRSRVLSFGIDPSATDAIDLALGEAQLPPPPPSNAFDARLVGDDIGIPLGQGSWVDYRQGDPLTGGTRVHEIKFQTSGGLTITVSWNFPNGTGGRLQDIITGSLIDVVMTGAGSYTVTNPSGFSRLMMTVSYEALLPIQLAAFTATQFSGTTVRLDWTTLSEINNYGFYLERRVEGDPAFTEVPNSFVEGHGTTNVPHDYEYTDVDVPSGSWWYRLKQVDLDGTVFFSDPVHVDVVTHVNESAPQGFALMQNYPNPFNPSTEIGFSVESNGPATLRVFNILGQKIMTLFDDNAVAGQYYRIRVDASSLASGMYYYSLQSGAKNDMKRFVVTK